MIKFKQFLALLLVVFSTVVSAQIQNFSSNGTYTVPAGVTSIKVQAWGGGGGGGTRITNSGATGGGGAGAYSSSVIAVTSGQTINITIGAGGGAGVNGGKTTVIRSGTTLVEANGGSGVANNATTGGNGGAISAYGTTQIAGGNGGNSGTNSGAGGDSPNGGNGGAAVTDYYTYNGNMGGLPGAGGSGNKKGSNFLITYYGGAGSGGMVVIEGISSSTTSAYWGSGSRDLFPAGALGHRARLISMNGNGWNFNPFPTLGRTYVYAKDGEKIHIGSSSQGRNKGTIKLYSPNGVMTTSGTSTTTGRITNRAQELAGPNVTGGNPAGYTPFSSGTITATNEGIWVVEFYAYNTDPTDGTATANDLVQGSHHSADDWGLTEGDRSLANTNDITAWDITVQKADDSFASGRVYTNVLNLAVNATKHTTGDDLGFYGKFYTYTRDGYAYEVNNNGQSGQSFNSFVNNLGALDKTKSPTAISTPTAPGYADYKSFDYSTYADVQKKFQDPRAADTQYDVTHKMFYGKPDITMPENASIWVPTGAPAFTSLWSTGTGSKGTTWLHKPNYGILPDDLVLVGAEGSIGTFTSKGAFFRFTSKVEGTYSISIPSSTGCTRTLTGNVYLGLNNVFWDGKDSCGVSMAGSTVSGVTLKLKAAELHFPFLDVENNGKGVEIRALDKDYNYVTNGDTVYWNAPLTDKGSLNPPTKVNLGGLPSYTGAKTIDISTNKRLWWGDVTENGNNFGDSRAIIVWANREGDTGAMSFPLVHKKTDLAVTSLTQSPSSPQVGIGDVITYTTTITNYGPDDAVVSGENNFAATFSFYIPKGVTIDPTAVAFNSSTGASIVADTWEFETEATKDNFVNKLTVIVNLPKDAIGTFTIPATITDVSSIQTAPGNKINAWSTIMRGNDVNDPNAFNGANINMLPIHPFYETTGIGKKVVELYMNANLDAISGTQFASLANPAAANETSTTKTNNIKWINLAILLSPKAYDDTKAGLQNTPVVIDILTNDKLNDGTTPTAANVVVKLYPPTGGTVSPDNKTVTVPGEGVWVYNSTTGQLTFTPEASFTGSPTPIQYTITKTSTAIESNKATVTITVSVTICFNDPKTGGSNHDTKVGITLLKRAGAQNADNWPMVRKSGHIALESNTQGFVVTRMTTAQLNAMKTAGTALEGMMSFDTDAKCLKIYTAGDWSCFNTPTCP